MQQVTFNAGTGHEIAARVAHDARADGGRRMVLLAPRRVTIKRRLQGMKMLLSVPVENYVGVVIACRERPNGAFYHLSLAHRDPELCVTLKEASDQAEIVDAWRRWAVFFAMPALIESATGEWEAFDSPHSEAPAPTPTFPRRRATLPNRRPRLLRRRKSGEIARLATVFRDEREIICYE